MSMADIANTVTKKPRLFHSIQIKISDEEWRKFRAITAYRKLEVGDVVGKVIVEWLKETPQRTLIAGLES
jgi:hypothetical protein